MERLYHKNANVSEPTLHHRIRRRTPLIRTLLGCGSVLLMAAAHPAAYADGGYLPADDADHLADRVFSGESFRSTRLDADEPAPSLGLSGTQGRLLWNLNFASINTAPRTWGAMDRAMAGMADDGSFGPAPVPGSGESLSLSAGWSLGAPADSATLYAGFGYTPRHWVLGDAGLSARGLADAEGYDAVQYGLGVTAPLGADLNVGLSYTRRYIGAEFDAAALTDEGEDTASLGLSYGRDSWSTNVTASMGDKDRAPEIVFSVRFPCCF